MYLGKQTPNPAISLDKNSEMEKGQDQTCGLTEKVKKHELRGGVICSWGTLPSPPVLVMGVGLGRSGNCVVHCISPASPCSQESEGTADSGPLSPGESRAWPG